MGMLEAGGAALDMCRHPRRSFSPGVATLLEAFAIDELHGEKMKSVFFADSKALNDVGVVKSAVTRASRLKRSTSLDFLQFA